MFKNYLKIAWRNLVKNKTFSIINISGLAVGLACCILMFLFIQHELSYDKFNKNASIIYRLTSQPLNAQVKAELATTPAPWAPIMKKDFPEINNYVRVLKSEKAVIGQPGKQKFYENDLLYADSTFFDVFTFRLLKGYEKQALQKPKSIILTKMAAEKYFGQDDPIGKTLEVNSFGGTSTVEVTGIVDDIPSNSHFKFNALVSLQTLGDVSEFWSFHMFHSYVTLNKNVSTKSLESKFAGFVDKYIANNSKADGKHDIHLQPLTSIHLHSQMQGEIGANGDIKYIYIFSGIALFVLLIACFNFTNLSTARSMARAKEVGLRKVVGAEKKQLVRQFLGESMLTALIALLLAIIITILVLPVFNQLSERDLSLDLVANQSLLLFFVFLVLFVGIIAGGYPAIVLSAFRPVDVLKSQRQKSGKGVTFRKVLVTFQFVISIALIASTIIVAQQLKFLQNKKLGFDKENVVIVTLPDIDSLKLQSFKASIQNSGAVISSASASSVPGVNIPRNLVNDGNIDLAKAHTMQMLFTDNDFIKTMNMRIIAGRDFSQEYATDRTEGFVLNEEAVKKAGFGTPEEAIGKKFQWINPEAVLKSGKVIGVVQDFNIKPLKSSVEPLVIHSAQDRLGYVYVRFKQQSASSVVDVISKNFKEVYPNQAFEYNYLDDTLNDLYNSERKTGRIFSSFSLMAILIACMGILGLSLYSIQQRTKEIGVRKVLGASIATIIGGLIKSFLWPVLIGALIAFPITWYAMNNWLKDFAYRIDIQWWVFILAGIIAALIAMITVSFQAVKAAVANPVKSLRTE